MKLNEEVEKQEGERTKKSGEKGQKGGFYCAILHNRCHSQISTSTMVVGGYRTYQFKTEVINVHYNRTLKSHYVQACSCYHSVLC